MSEKVQAHLRQAARSILVALDSAATKDDPGQVIRYTDEAIDRAGKAIASCLVWKEQLREARDGD